MVVAYLQLSVHLDKRKLQDKTHLHLFEYNKRKYYTKEECVYFSKR